MEPAPSNLFARLKSARRLPSPPGAAVRVLQLCRSEDPGLKEISEVIAADPALSARILKFANSPATGLARKVRTVREAVLLMGVRSVKLAALGFCLATPENEAACPGFDLRQYWSEACATAVISRCIAKEHFKADPEEAFTAGLLAGIGRLAMAQGVPEEYSRMLDRGVPDQQLLELEQSNFGITHAELGAELLQDWRLPVELVEAVRYVPAAMAGDASASTLSRVVAAAIRLTPWFAQSRVSPEQQATIRGTVDNELKLDSLAWEALCERVREGYASMAEVLNLRLTPGVTVMDLYAEAQEEAARVGMVAQLERVQVDRDVAELRKRAMTDPLTGTANRASFDEKLAELLRESAKGQHFALVLLDIDHFKLFNDTHGHQVGDLVLTRVARSIQNTMRNVDLMARYGGEEFAILVAGATREGACMVAAKAKKTIESLLVQAHEKRLSVTISLGIAVSEDWKRPPTAAEVVAEADKQLYLSKQAGRNTWSYRGKTARRTVSPVREAA